MKDRSLMPQLQQTGWFTIKYDINLWKTTIINDLIENKLIDPKRLIGRVEEPHIRDQFIEHLFLLVMILDELAIHYIDTLKAELLNKIILNCECLIEKYKACDDTVIQEIIHLYLHELKSQAAFFYIQEIKAIKLKTAPSANCFFCCTSTVEEDEPLSPVHQL